MRYIVELAIFLRFKCIAQFSVKEQLKNIETNWSFK